MAKKKKMKTNLTQIVTAAAVLLGIIAVAMIFVPTVTVKGILNTYTFTGLNLAFGCNLENTSTAIFEFSFMNLLTYILALAGTVVALMGLIKNSFASGLFRIIAAACFIIAGVFFFMSINFCIPNTTASNITKLFNGDIKSAGTLAVGAYIGGITAIIAGVCELLSVFVFNK